MNLKKDKRDHSRSSVRSASSREYIQARSSDPSKSDTTAWEPALTPTIPNILREKSVESLKSTGSKEGSENTVRGTSQKSEVKEARVIESKNTKSDMKSMKRIERENTARLLQQVQNSSVERPMVAGTPRRLFLMRHAERVDLTFGHDWFQVYIDDKGYHRRNLNLPRRIPTRRGGPKDFFMDGPISEIGTFQAKLIGEAFRAKGVTFSKVFSSPSLRSIQTATSLLEGMMDTTTKIKVEPALFEWMAWCRNTLPKFMNIEELCDYGFNIDMDYYPFYKFAQFNAHEKTDEYYFRSYSFVDNELRVNSGDILMVGHSATLDVCSRQLTGQPIRKTDDLVRVVQKVPFCGLCTVEESINSRKWNLVQGPIPSLAHGQNSTFDWRIMETTANGPPYGKGK